MSFTQCRGLCRAPCGPNCHLLFTQNSIGHDRQPYTNKTQKLHDDQGWTVPFTQTPTFSPPLFINIESKRRDTAQFPFSNSFALDLGDTIHGVRSIEVVDFSMPTLIETDMPPGGYFFLANGLVSNYAVDAAGEPLAGQEGSFQSQGLVGHYIGSGTASTRDVSCNSFAKFPYQSHVPLQVWERQNARKVTYLKPEKETLRRLEFCLLDNNAKPLRLQKIPLALPVDDNCDDEWTCTLMITARRH